MRTSGQQYRPLSRRKPTSLVQARGAPDDLRRPVPIWSSGQDSWFSPRRPGFDSRYGKAGSSLLRTARTSSCVGSRFWPAVELQKADRPRLCPHSPVPSIAQLVERRTVGAELAILRSLARRRPFFTRTPFVLEGDGLLKRASRARLRSPPLGGKRAFPDRESNPGRGGESAES
ncbi:hypothetical protein QQF64_003180 [Cirrhinus molitorella]|uniref:Uncharacterized protein n=1 Tax=Cirrhinus molitorella TaxID=172907 RepID=A0ABR3MJB2_9TELE